MSASWTTDREHLHIASANLLPATGNTGMDADPLDLFSRLRLDAYCCGFTAIFCHCRGFKKSLLNKFNSDVTILLLYWQYQEYLPTCIFLAKDIAFFIQTLIIMTVVNVTFKVIDNL